MAESRNTAEHWEKIYRSKSASQVSWYEPRLAVSVDAIVNTGVGHDARIIDVGAGASTLVDSLLELGFARITALDLAPSALEVSKRRLGTHAARVEWIVGDVTSVDLPGNRYDIWHDRAVFHFLTSQDQRQAYVKQVCRSLRSGGFLVMATFGPHGPEQCSSLPVVKYSAERLWAEFGNAFTVEQSSIEPHRTPSGTVQEFLYCCCRKTRPC